MVELDHLIERKLEQNRLDGEMRAISASSQRLKNSVDSLNSLVEAS